ncbi:MAG: hypothetical protein QG663_1724 [Thermodesulfobacteriota bacterium]|jgi:hypothetical protein|nr:hypothetical protein [Thermodesulfobacteriota bacterium]
MDIDGKAPGLLFVIPYAPLYVVPEDVWEHCQETKQGSNSTMKPN